MTRLKGFLIAIGIWLGTMAPVGASPAAPAGGAERASPARPPAPQDFAFVVHLGEPFVILSTSVDG
jgi:hypothetical protein